MGARKLRGERRLISWVRAAPLAAIVILAAGILVPSSPTLAAPGYLGLTGSDRYETALRHGAAGAGLVAREPPPEPARSAAFRRIVSEIYDYRCAASGWRIILPDSRVMVEAAHLVPFAESHDDDPRNGIALVPSFHWALDKNVIAPGPDYLWRVSKALDERVADNQPLLALAGKSLMLPKEKSLWPKKEALEWRVAHLLER